MEIERKDLKKASGALISVLLIVIWLGLPIYVQNEYGIHFAETGFVIIIVYYLAYRIIRRTDLFSS